MAKQAGAAVARALTWLTGMQSRDGGWGAFDADNTSRLVSKLPFCDFGEVIDPPSADVTAHIVEMLAAAGLGAEPGARRGVAWLLRAQEPDGSWFGRWGANYVYGTGAVVPALLVAAGVLPTSRASGAPCAGSSSTRIRTAAGARTCGRTPIRGLGRPGRVDRLADGVGAAGTARGWRRRRDGQRGAAASAWLAATQRADGTWDEPQFTGTGFPGDFYINYHLYRLVFPISALGRYLGGCGDEQS